MAERDVPIQTGQGLYEKTQEAGACIFIDDPTWGIDTDAETNATIITIPAHARWRVTTDTFRSSPDKPGPSQWLPGQQLIAIFLKEGKLRPEDEGRVTLIEDLSS